MPAKNFLLLLGSLLLILIIHSNSADLQNVSSYTPSEGTLFHGAFAPIKDQRSEHEVTQESIRSYEIAAGKDIAIGVVSNEWSMNRSFPTQQAEIIRSGGAVPYIRLMLRSDTRLNRIEPMFTISRIRDGLYDADLSYWSRDAHNFNTPIIVEWGTEVNGNWFPWNGYWNDQEAGARKFRDAYRHIIELTKKEGADNIIWVYHVNWISIPDKEWNSYSSYYPGDDYIDWIGVSLYGALNSDSNPNGTFSEHMDFVYPQLKQIGSEKPIIISEFGTDFNNKKVDAYNWTLDALSNITSGRWPLVIGFCWWNTEWPNDDNPLHNTSMRIQERPEISALFHQYIGDRDNILSRIQDNQTNASSSRDQSTG